MQIMGMSDQMDSVRIELDLLQIRVQCNGGAAAEAAVVAGGVEALQHAVVAVEVADQPVAALEAADQQLVAVSAADLVAADGRRGIKRRYFSQWINGERHRWVQKDGPMSRSESLSRAREGRARRENRFLKTSAISAVVEMAQVTAFKLGVKQATRASHLFIGFNHT